MAEGRVGTVGGFTIVAFVDDVVEERVVVVVLFGASTATLAAFLASIMARILSCFSKRCFSASSNRNFSA